MSFTLIFLLSWTKRRIILYCIALHCFEFCGVEYQVENFAYSKHLVIIVIPGASADMGKSTVIA
jgi:hypothetical protein